MSPLLGSIAGVSLLVGGIGIMNIMLVSVTERTKRNQYQNGYWCKINRYSDSILIESLLLSIIGGILGLLLE